MECLVRELESHIKIPIPGPKMPWDCFFASVFMETSEDSYIQSREKPTRNQFGVGCTQFILDHPIQQKHSHTTLLHQLITLWYHHVRSFSETTFSVRHPPGLPVGLHRRCPGSIDRSSIRRSIPPWQATRISQSKLYQNRWWSKAIGEHSFSASFTSPT